MSHDTLVSAQAIDYSSPPEECDLVMKGGITSGVVYPPAVLKLGTRYRFRAIGGTSAGAIAAAATAAAEFGREQGGFHQLERISRQLSQPGFLFHLFQPSPATEPLMNTVFAMAAEAQKDRPRLTTRLLRRFTTTLFKQRRAAFVKGALVGAGLPSAYALLNGASLKKSGLVPPIVLFGWLGALIGGSYDLARILLREIPNNNFFGVCTGLGNDSSSQVDVLTTWLNASINELAGRDKDGEPLTFRDLSEKKLAGKDAGIFLRMVTTNLSQSRPYVIPFDVNSFLFNEDEMRQIFPKPVVDHLVKHAHQSRRIRLDHLPGYHFLPEADDLPVIVGARMSLSFPLLISAVPLYTIKQSVFGSRSDAQSVQLSSPDDLQKNWFSDGGICSNFPIHFFDDWLPLRPTFGINLTSLPEQAFDDPIQTKPEFKSYSGLDAMRPDAAPLDVDDSISDAVWLPRADATIAPDWTEINRLLEFVSAIFRSAQNYRDNTQAVLPSYRDRIVQVRFAPNEGGLNLAMDEQTIREIQLKGEKAAEKILESFQLPHHQWVRFQVLMALLERQLKSMEEALRDGNYEQIINTQEQLRAQPDSSQWYPYPQDKEWCAEAIKRISALQTYIEHQVTQQWLVKQPPRPEPAMRVTPEV